MIAVLVQGADLVVELSDGRQLDVALLENGSCGVYGALVMNGASLMGLGTEAWYGPDLLWHCE